MVSSCPFLHSHVKCELQEELQESGCVYYLLTYNLYAYRIVLDLSCVSL